MSKPSLFRLLFVGLWFVLVPALLAFVAVQLLKGRADDLTIGYIRGFVRDQPIPAGIVLFTVFEMTLWRLRHELPLSARLAIAGRTGLTAKLRRDFEAAAQLIDESERILESRRKAVERAMAAERVDELTHALAALRESMRADPFDGGVFQSAFAEASELSDRLEPWRKSELREYVESIGFAVLVALLLRAVVIEAFKIPSGSMLPTLQIDDHIFVNKFIYGPTVPLTKTRLLSRMPPKRGDVIVFEFPNHDPKATPQDYIKRVIALPGDVLEAKGGHPIINGFALPWCNAGAYARPDHRGFGMGGQELHVEFLGEYAYLTLIEPFRETEHEGPYEVAADEVWVFGDNRHNSSDSRAWNGGRGGGVPFRNIKGRAMFVWLPLPRLMVNVMGSPQLPKDVPDELVRGVAKCLEQRPSPADATPPGPPGRR